MQDAHEVAGRIVAAAALLVLGLDHHTAAGGDDRCALGHGDIHRITPLRGEVAVGAIGALSLAEGSATPGQRVTMDARLQARIAEGVTQLRLVAQRLRGLLRGERCQTYVAAWRQYPAN